MNNNVKYQKKCIVIGTNYCTILTVVRSLGLKGYKSNVIRIYKNKPNKLNPLNNIKIDSYSKYVDSFTEVLSNDYEIIVQHLIDNGDLSIKIPLFPIDDYSVYIVDKYYKELSDYYYIPNINEESGKINALMNKNSQKELASKSGIPILNSTLIQIKNGEFEIPSSVEYPCFVKPNISMKSRKSIMKKCNNKEELNKLLSTFCINKDLDLLIEKYVEIKNEYSLLGVSTKNNVIIPSAFKVILGGNRARKGVTVVGEIIDSIKLNDIIKKCAQYVHNLGYIGLFDIDLVELENGDIYFFEINFRTGASVYASTEIGVNLPGILADYFVTNKMNDEFITVDKLNQRFVNEKNILEELATGDISVNDAKKYLKSSQINFIENDEDIAPYQHFKKYYFIAILMSFIYRIRDMIKK